MRLSAITETINGTKVSDLTVAKVMVATGSYIKGRKRVAKAITGIVHAEPEPYRTRWKLNGSHEKKELSLKI